MTQVDIRNVRAFYGQTEVLKGVSMRLEDSDFVSILGPSGCGKTTLLRVLAGFVHYQGQVLIDGASCDRLPAHKRHIGIVFQDYALFPHMTAARNIQYGLELRRLPRETISGRTAELMELLQLEGLGERFPGELSGGQRQRVALARALAIEPRILLLDEPLSALDKKLREEMQVELRQIQKRVGITTLFVTHDQEEALAMADKIVVMDEGEIRQIGTPDEIYRAPADRFVAEFIGKSNILDAEAVDEERGQLLCRLFEDVSVRVPLAGERPANGSLYISVRPERLRLDARRAAPENDNRIPGTIDHVVYLGAHQLVRVSLGDGTSMDIDTDSETQWRIGDSVTVHWRPEDGVLLGA